ncbi:unnamed protein product [Ambrosiozyma monospora]|uniref:Unnamed protein product n=1 Tax=Ambrosiozyma monospora TaxID=43982 RepID=A0ACB5T655_AMBMO|nr:unnamed protein product [Ambrosiozyma monospora]
MMSISNPSWADAEELPQNEVIENNDGTKTIISYKYNNGKKIKHTQKIKLVKVTESVDPAVAARRKWKRYGAEKNNKTVGPDARTTQFGEEVKLILSNSWAREAKQEEEEKKKESKATSKAITCRTCGGEHFTTKCPFKDTLGAEKKPESATGSPAPGSVPATPTLGSGASSYVPPHLRNRGPGAPPLHDRRERDDSTTLKVMNLNTAATEDQLRQVFSRFGNPQRVTIVRNRETRESRGLAFIEMDSIRTAQAAKDTLDGKGFLSMIMSVDWSKPKKN